MIKNDFVHIQLSRQLTKKKVARAVFYLPVQSSSVAVDIYFHHLSFPTFESQVLNKVSSFQRKSGQTSFPASLSILS